MFIRVILALALAIMLFSGSGLSGFGISSFKSSISDKELETSTAILDKAIISWYTNHSGVVPDVISADMIKIMGLEDMDVSKFTYTKLADNKFSLVVQLSGNRTLSSANSNKDLPELASYGNTPGN